MEPRTNEAPMEFEWQTRAPGDATSPFYQLAMQHEQQNKKRPFSVFDSPAKPSTPGIRDPTSQPFLFGQPSPTTTASPASPIRPAAFSTPRKADLGFSSGTENVSSPEHADNDETPESRSQRRGSIFNFYGRFAGPSAGRGEIPRSNRFSNVLIHRVKKKRRRDRELERHIRRTSHDDEATGGPTSRDQSDKHHGQQHNNTAPPLSHEIPFFSRLFTFLESHPHIPRILSYYAQFAFNLTLAFLTLYVIVAFLLAIRADVRRASEARSADILSEMASCARSYVENRCSSDKRLPALETVCDNWDRCMNQDPAKVGNAKVSAQTLAEIVNGFIEPISFKAMSFVIAALTSFVAVSNFTFTFFRTKSNNPPHPAPQQPPPHHAYRPFTPPGMVPQPSYLAYSSSQPAFGMHGTPSHFGYQSQQSFNHPFTPTPSHARGGNNEGPRQRQLEYRDPDCFRTPSPVKGRNFA